MFLATVHAPRGGIRGQGRIALFAALAVVAHFTPAVAGDAKEGPEFRQGEPELRWTVPYQVGKVPVVFVHGFLGSHVNWTVMIDKLSADPAVCGRFQLLTFEYDSLQAIPETGRKLLAALDEARRRFDPEGRDAAFDRVIVVGHSLGGLVAKSAALGFDQVLPGAGGAPPSGQVRPASPRIGRIIFVATPHRGTAVDQSATRSAAIWFARKFNTLSPAPRPKERNAVADAPTSVDQLRWDHPLLAELQRAGTAAGIPCHSIIATLQDPSAREGTDGLVPVVSARLEGARSELLVRTNHFCFQHPQVIGEVRRVLIEHGAEPVDDANAVRTEPRP